MDEGPTRRPEVYFTAPKGCGGCCGGNAWRGQVTLAGSMAWRYPEQSSFECTTADMIELNPVRQRITDLTDRVLSLRGYL